MRAIRKMFKNFDISKFYLKPRKRLQHSSLYIFGTENRFRLYIHAISKTAVFEYFILIAILSSVFLLGYQGSEPEGKYKEEINVFELVLNIIFCFEAIIKIIANGFVIHHEAYLRNSWNVFDFIIVLSGIVSDILTYSNALEKSFSLTYLRMFRVLRPLRLIVKSDNLRVVMDAILKAFGSILHVLLFILLIMTLYAISGIELFSGLLRNACYIHNITADPLTYCLEGDHKKCIGIFPNDTKVQCLTLIKNDNEFNIQSFDHIGAALLTTIQVLTMEDWVFLVYDLNQVASPYLTWPFFISLVWVGGYFAVDLLMGVLGNQYLRTKHFNKRILAIKDLENADQNKELVIVVNNPPQPKELKWHQKLHKRAQKWSWKLVHSLLFFWYCDIGLVVFDCVVTTMFAHMATGTGKSSLYAYIKLGILLLYFAETCLIILAIGFEKAWNQGLYVFNSIICIVGFAELIKYAIQDDFYIGLSIIRSVTLIQVFKRTRFWPQLSSIVRSFVESIKGVIHVQILLLIILINYALLGNLIFGRPDLDRDRLGTFDDFGNSLLLSFVLLTGDNWPQEMLDNTNAVGSFYMGLLSILYFISFVLCGNFILMNIFLGIIVDNLTSDYEKRALKNEITNRKMKFKSTVGVIGALMRKTRSTKSASSSSGKDKSNADGTPSDHMICCHLFPKSKVTDCSSCFPSSSNTDVFDDEGKHEESIPRICTCPSGSNTSLANQNPGNSNPESQQQEINGNSDPMMQGSKNETVLNMSNYGNFSSLVQPQPSPGRSADNSNNAINNIKQENSACIAIDGSIEPMKGEKDQNKSCDNDKKEKNTNGIDTLSVGKKLNSNIDNTSNVNTIDNSFNSMNKSLNTNKPSTSGTIKQPSYQITITNDKEDETKDTITDINTNDVPKKKEKSRKKSSLKDVIKNKLLPKTKGTDGDNNLEPQGSKVLNVRFISSILSVLSSRINSRRVTIRSISKNMRSRVRAVSILFDPDISCPIPNHKSLFLFHQNHPVREWVFGLVASTSFTLLVYFAIILSSFYMAFDTPINEDPSKKLVMDIFDYTFTAFFTLEIIMKSIAYGLIIGHHQCYLRHPLNIIDTIVVSIAVTNVFLKLYGFEEKYMQFRILRVIRAVRVLKISSELKHVINCLVNSLKRIVYFLVMYIIILFVYAVIGVHLYSDIIGTCGYTDYTAKVGGEQVPTKTILSKQECIDNNFTWQPASLTFDQLSDGMITLFVLSTMDDWFNYLKTMIRLNGINQNVAIVYVVSFILIMSFVMLNVFIGFVIVVFHQEKQKEDIYQVLDKEAQECIHLALTVRPLVNKAPKPGEFGGTRQIFGRIVQAKWFTLLSIAMIILNTLLLMSKTDSQSAEMTHFQKRSNLALTIFFTLEIVAKFIGLPLRTVIFDSWMLFDIFAVIGSWIDILLELLGQNFLNLSVFRLFRVARLAKVVGKGGNIRQLVATFLKSMKSVPSIACLLGLLLYVYAIIGMEMFGHIKTMRGSAINENANFQTFTSSILLLIRITTLDQWHEVMLACADRKTENCVHTHEPGSTNCGSVFAYIYFATFVFLCSYIMTNVFLAIIMENFVYLTNDAATLDCRHIHNFKKAWMKYDINKEGTISINEMIQLLRVVDPPLGVGLFCPHRTVYGKLMRIRVPIERDGRVRFNELLLTLVLDSLKSEASTDMLRSDIQHLVPNVTDDILDRVLPLDYDPRVYNKAENNFYQLCAVYIIKGHYRLYKEKKDNIGDVVNNIICI